MRRDVLTDLLALAADTAPSPDSSNALTIAIIGGLVTVIVALIGLFGTQLVARGNRTPQPTIPPPSDLDHQAALERFLMRQGFDPNKITDGDEWPNDVKFF